MRTIIKLCAAGVGVTLAVVAGTAGTATAHDDTHGRDLAELRSATAQFHRLDVAKGAGYGLFSDAAGITCIEDPGGAGAMGTHYANIDEVVDGQIDVREPEVLLYDLSGSKPKLLGAEYVVFVADWGADRDPPVLFGHEFHLVPEPNRYGLPPFYETHAWVWEHNPSGMVADWNPRIDC